MRTVMMLIPVSILLTGCMDPSLLESPEAALQRLRSDTGPSKWELPALPEIAQPAKDDFSGTGKGKQPFDLTRLGK